MGGGVLVVSGDREGEFPQFDCDKPGEGLEDEGGLGFPKKTAGKIKKVVVP